MGGHGVDRHMAVQGAGLAVAQAPGRLQAIDIRHFHIHEHEIEGFPGQGRKRFPTAAGDHGFVAAPAEIGGGHLDVDRVVLGHEDAKGHSGLLGKGGRGCGRVGCRDRRLTRGEGQGGGENAAVSGFAGHVDVPAHEAGQFPADGQAQARAAVMLADQGVGLGEQFEDVFELVPGNADAGVGHAKVEGDGIRGRRGRMGRADRQVDAAFSGEFDGVADEVHENLAQPALVSPDVARDGRSQAQVQGQALGRGLGTQGADHGRHGAAQIEILHGEFELAGLDAGDVQDVVDDGEQDLGGFPGGVQGVALFRGQGRGQGQFGHADDGVERGADFVAHLGQEIAFGPGGGFGRVLGGAQVVFIGGQHGHVPGDDEIAAVAAGLGRVAAAAQGHREKCAVLAAVAFEIHPGHRHIVPGECLAFGQEVRAVLGGEIPYGNPAQFLLAVAEHVLKGRIGLRDTVLPVHGREPVSHGGEQGAVLALRGGQGAFGTFALADVHDHGHDAGRGARGGPEDRFEDDHVVERIVPEGNRTFVDAGLVRIFEEAAILGLAEFGLGRGGEAAGLLAEDDGQGMQGLFISPVAAEIATVQVLVEKRRGHDVDELLGEADTFFEGGAHGIEGPGQVGDFVAACGQARAAAEIARGHVLGHTGQAGRGAQDEKLGKGVGGGQGQGQNQGKQGHVPLHGRVQRRQYGRQRTAQPEDQLGFPSDADRNGNIAVGHAAWARRGPAQMGIGPGLGWDIRGVGHVLADALRFFRPGGQDTAGGVEEPGFCLVGKAHAGKKM